jgi:hypothetical protein
MKATAICSVDDQRRIVREGSRVPLQRSPATGLFHRPGFPVLRPLPGRGATNFSFQVLDPTQNLAEATIELANAHVTGRVGLEQEETDFPLKAGTSFAEPLHEQPHQLGVLG